MPREKESYRDNLELILEAFPDTKLLTAQDVAKWAGRDRHLIRKLYFNPGEKYITPAMLARRIS